MGTISGSSASRAARRGAEAQMYATSRAIREQRRARAQSERLLSPYMAVGQEVLPELQDIAGQELQGLPSVLPGDIGQDSLFQALKQQAISGIESSAAARGKLFSGTTPQAIADRVQQLALARAGDIQQQNVMARQQLMGEQQQRFGQLFNVAGLGQASAAGQAANVMGTAQGIGELYTQQGNVAAAARMAGPQARAQVLQGYMQAAGAAAGAAVGASDMRIKTDITPIGKMDNGLPLYSFRYIGKTELHMGVMAQDVEKVNPDAVIEINGIKHVKYGELSNGN